MESLKITIEACRRYGQNENLSLPPQLPPELRARLVTSLWPESISAKVSARHKAGQGRSVREPESLCQSLNELGIGKPAEAAQPDDQISSQRIKDGNGVAPQLVARLSPTPADAAQVLLVEQSGDYRGRAGTLHQAQQEDARMSDADLDDEAIEPQAEKQSQAQESGDFLDRKSLHHVASIHSI